MARPACRRRLNVLEAQFGQLERVDERIDRANRIALADPVIEGSVSGQSGKRPIKHGTTGLLLAPKIRPGQTMRRERPPPFGSLRIQFEPAATLGMSISNSDAQREFPSLHGPAQARIARNATPPIARRQRILCSPRIPSRSTCPAMPRRFELDAGRRDVRSARGAARLLWACHHAPVATPVEWDGRNVRIEEQGGGLPTARMRCASEFESYMPRVTAGSNWMRREMLRMHSEIDASAAASSRCMNYPRDSCDLRADQPAFSSVSRIFQPNGLSALEVPSACCCE